MNQRPGFMAKLKKTARRAWWRVYGRAIRKFGLPPGAGTILYVCKGNIVRSPFAEHLSNRLIADERAPSIPLNFSSAGLVTPDVQASPEEAVRTAAQFNVSLREHRPRLINYSMVESHDLIVAMDVWQYGLLKRMFPEHARKIVLLPLYDRERDKYDDPYWKYNIVDPYGKSIEHYVDCYRRMSAVIRDFIGAVRAARISV
jgi:protein-tyrosine-phosphatase